MRPIICAHRGNSVYCPENTLAAIASAADLGIPMTEIDVRRTADGHIVLMHDETTDRTTDGSGRIAELSLEQIRGFDAGSWKGPEFAGERVPTLAETLDLCSERRMFLCIEIKQKGIVPEVVELVQEAGMVEGAVIISFDFDTVVQLRQANPAIPAGWLTADMDPSDVDAAISRVLSHDIPVISALHTCVTRDVVRRCRLRGVTLYVWTIDEVAEARRYAEMGVDVIASNCPGELQEALG
jgi:glycerophosphoryl diester phosphodiesterase